MAVSWGYGVSAAILVDLPGLVMFNGHNEMKRKGLAQVARVARDWSDVVKVGISY